MGVVLDPKEVVQTVWSHISVDINKEQQRKLINWVRQRGYKGDISKALMVPCNINQAGFLAKVHTPHHCLSKFPVLRFQEEADCGAWG